jgi:hypothetical protein
MGYAGPPSFPVTCRIWVGQFTSLPLGPPTSSSACSISPVPASYWGGINGAVSPLTDTIIRMPATTLVEDGYNARLPDFGPPYSYIEAPAFSGNIYVVNFSHIVARGFPNTFRRCYCGRVVANWTGPSPP